jgi:SSS family transporter
MSSGLLLFIILVYFLLLLFISWYTSRNANNESFFIGNKSSNWMLVAFGMIGTSLSGVTFISVPGTVGNFDGNAYKAFSYLQVVFGYFIGYFAVAFVLLPLYYKLNLTSIYSFLQKRFGQIAYKTGALFFILSRTIGATARLYLVINVLQIFILDAMGVPFLVTAIVILLMILLYTYEGGVKTIVYTDTLQTLCMLSGLIICIIILLSKADVSVVSAFTQLQQHDYTSIFNTNPDSKSFFLKQIIGGMFITISMTGLDQEMMQKNISVKSLHDAKKNMLSFSVILVLVNCLFLLLGGLLYLYMLQQGASYETVTSAAGTVQHQLLLNGKNILGDDIFPTVALQFLPPVISIIFVIALISALFPSADGALTALTSSFCIDILNLKNNMQKTDAEKRKTRIRVHLSFAVIFLLCILAFKWINNKSIIFVILDLAGYTYGPLLGLFSFGIFTKRILPNAGSISAVCIASPVLCYFLSKHAAAWFGGYQIGFELLLINGLLTFIFLFLLSKKQAKDVAV